MFKRKQSDKKVLGKEQQTLEMNFQFIDVDDPDKEPMGNLDMDNVILSEGQKNLLFWQCIGSRQFWVLYFMQGLSILFAYYVVNVYKIFGLTVPELDND